MQNKVVPAKFDRQLISDIFSGGVAGGAAMLVTSSGGARSVSIAKGSCYVPGTNSADQGTYRVFNDASATLQHDAAVTFPRVDQIVCRIQDAADLGSGPDIGGIEIVKGTEANGATLVNRSGAVLDGALPLNVIRLADVLVPVGANPVIPNTNINDRRPMAAIKAAGALPIGSIIADAGAGEISDGSWVPADGRLVDKTIYALFFTRVGHAFNNGADPLGNKVRVPDLRGRSPIGAVNFGTDGTNGVTAVSGSDNGRYQGARGLTDGEILHLLTGPESGVNGSGGLSSGAIGGMTKVIGEGGTPSSYYTGNGAIAGAISMGIGILSLSNLGLAGQSANTPHQTVHPVQATSFLVRIA